MQNPAQGTSNLPAMGSRPRTVAMLLLVSLLSTACGGGGSDLGNLLAPPDSEATVRPEPGKADVLVFRSPPESGPSRLYKVDRMGESTLLSDAAGDASIEYFNVAPDTEQLTYNYTTRIGQPAVAVVNISTGDTAPPWLAAVGEVILPQWLPDSQGILYNVIHADRLGESLYLAKSGVADSKHLLTTDPGMATRMNVAVSADSTRVAVETRAYADVNRPLFPQSSNLYLLDLVEMTEPLPIDTTSGDANLFDLSWSPTGRRLLYSQSQYIGPTLPGASVSRPAGPLVLLDTDKVSRAIANYPNFFIVRWIDEQRFLVSRFGGFDLLDTEGTLLTSQPRTGPWQVVPSPDKRWLAWLAPEAGVVAVHLLNLESGEIHSIGPASATELPRNQFIDVSLLHWSPDGSWLAWNRELEGDAAELYAYRVSTGETQVVSTDYSGLIAPLWLPQGQRLGYLTHATNGVELTITNLISGKSYTVGYSADTDDCNPTAAWGPSNEVLWYRCAEGVYVSRIAADGAITEKRLFDERANIYVSANHQIALLEPIAVNPANSLQPNRMIYDFLEDRLIELADTEGSLWFEFLQ